MLERVEQSITRKTEEGPLQNWLGPPLGFCPLPWAATADSVLILVGKNPGFKPDKQVEGHMGKLFTEQNLSSIFTGSAV
jgi:hypothetical protein